MAAAHDDGVQGLDFAGQVERDAADVSRWPEAAAFPFDPAQNVRSCPGVLVGTHAKGWVADLALTVTPRACQTCAFNWAQFEWKYFGASSKSACWPSLD